jgi:hypothetical protein
VSCLLSLVLFYLPQPCELSGKTLVPLLKSDIEVDQSTCAQHPIFHPHERCVGQRAVQYAAIDPARWKPSCTYSNRIAARVASICYGSGKGSVSAEANESVPCCPLGSGSSKRWNPLVVVNIASGDQSLQLRLTSR